MQWFKKWAEFINENLFVNRIKDDIASIMSKCEYQLLNFSDVFQLNASQDLELLVTESDFLEKIKKKSLRPTDLEKSSDTSSLVLNPIQYVLLYNDTDTEGSNPVYMLIQSDKNPVQLYYVTESINRFFEYLTNRIIVASKDGKEWVYKTTNAGENWTLQSKKTATPTMKVEMYGDELAELEKSNQINIEIK